MPKEPNAPQTDGADFATAAARMLEAATAEPIPESIVRLAGQLEDALTKALPPVRSSNEER